MARSIKLSISFVVVLMLLQRDSLAARVVPMSNGTDSFYLRTFVGLRSSIDEALGIHCQSKNDDLGFHVIRKGENWEFSFHPNFFFNTQFFCSFRWAGEFHYFDVYVQTRDFFWTPLICWEVTTTGPCRQEGADGRKCYPWN